MMKDRPRKTAVLEALDTVTDPELDRSIVELEYVDAIEIDAPNVAVQFTLPTAWCSPAFAWMMSVDARDAIEALPAVEEATITLGEHMHDAEINHGVNERLTFEETFPDADGDVEGVRAELDEKARVARQYDAVEALLEAGLDAEQIVSLREPDLEGLDGPTETVVSLRDRTVAVCVPTDPLERYLEKARETGIVSGPEDVLFRTPEGEPIRLEEFDLVQRRCRLARVNMSAQGGVCSGLHEARQKRLEKPADD